MDALYYNTSIRIGVRDTPLSLHPDTIRYLIEPERMRTMSGRLRS